jgi:hypothetical protein
VRVVSVNGVKVMASERSLYKTSMNETPGMTVSATTPPTEYWFPWYDTTYMQTSILVGNPNSSGDAANVQISVAGTTDGPYSIPAGGVITESYPGLFDGPVKVISTNGVSIFTTERSYYGDSYTETPGMLASQFTTDYWFPWYDFRYMQTWIAIGNPTAQTANVDIYIHGVKMNTSSIVIPAGGRMNPYYPDMFDGPVEVVSTNGVNIFVTERTLYQTSFEEVTGIPANQLTSQYWFPWYDFRYMQTWISIGRP